MTIRCVGAIVTDDAGRLLLIRRANEPGRGLWSLPGGRVEPGETDEQAVAREVREETGLEVRVGRLVGRIAIPAPGAGSPPDSYDVGDYACDLVGGTLRAATDALDAAFADPRTLPTTPRLVETLTGWGLLSQSVDSESG